MIQFCFNEEHAEQVIGDLLAGRPIEPPGGTWDEMNLLLFCGLARYVAVDLAMKRERTADLLAERGEAMNRQLINATSLATEIIAFLASAVVTGAYTPSGWARFVAARIHGHQLFPVKGFPPDWERQLDLEPRIDQDLKENGNGEHE